MKRKSEFHFILNPLILAFCTILFFSCEDQIEVNLESGESLLVVDGWITDQQGPHTVTLSKTAPYFHNGPTSKILGAEVTIFDEEGNEEVLIERGDGKYQTSESFKGKIGGVYKLVFDFEGEVYEAITSIRRPAVIDSLSVKYKESSFIWEEGYYVLLNAAEIEGVGDFFRFKVYQNGEFLNKPENLIVADDRLVDGNYLEGVEVNFKPFKKGDQIRVETWSITEEAFHFYLEMRQQIDNGGLYESPSANIPTNVFNTQPGNNNKAAGFFGGASVVYKEITIN